MVISRDDALAGLGLSAIVAAFALPELKANRLRRDHTIVERPDGKVHRYRVTAVSKGCDRNHVHVTVNSVTHWCYDSLAVVEIER